MTIDAETAKVNKDLAEARQFDANAIKASAEADLFVLQKADLEVHFRSTERDERLSRITTTTNRTLVVWGQINEELIYTNIFRLRTFVHEANTSVKSQVQSTSSFAVQAARHSPAWRCSTKLQRSVGPAGCSTDMSEGGLPRCPAFCCKLARTDMSVLNLGC